MRIGNLLKIGAFLCCLLPVCAWAQDGQAQAGGPEHARLAAPPDDMFVDLRVPAHQIYLGETIRVAYDVYVASSRGQVFYNVEEPDFAHWYVVEGRTAPAGHASFDGKTYTHEPYAVFFVTAMTAGKISLPPLKAEVPYLPSKPWVMNTPRVVEVLPLPEPRPAGMAIGNVGNFEISGSLSEREIRVGDVVNLKVKVWSDSPAAGIGLAPYVIGEDPEAFRVYPTINDLTEEKVIGDRLMSKREFRIRLMALKTGSFTLPPVEIVTFEPQHHQYKRLATEPFEIRVGDGYLPETSVRAQTHRLDSVSIRDIRLSHRNASCVIPLGWLALAPVLFLVWLIGMIFYRRVRRMRQDSERVKAAEQCLESLETADTAQAQLDIIGKIMDVRFGLGLDDGRDAFYAELEKLLTAEELSVLKSSIAALKENVYSTKKPLSEKALSEVVSALRRAVRRGGRV